MPYRDGTGPEEAGPRERSVPCMHGRRMHRYHTCGSGYGFENPTAVSGHGEMLTADEQRKVLDAELEELEAEKQAIARRLKELDAEKGQ